MKSPFSFIRVGAAYDMATGEISHPVEAPEATTHFIGYARVSSADQSLDVQRERLREVGCVKIFEEKITGTHANRPELIDMLDYVREGDVVVVTRIDRMARSVGDLMYIVDVLKSKGVGFKATEQAIDTTSPAGVAFLQMLGVFAQFETAVRSDRQREGYARKKAEGKVFGRPPTATKEQVVALAKAGKTPQQIAIELGIDVSNVYRKSKGMWGPSMKDQNRVRKEEALAKKGKK